ncbi:MAG: putative ketoacyl reductase [Chlamydiae bacterium]|nr:putative ketoacyl reductase [Chlamydiota bacterium]
MSIKSHSSTLVIGATSEIGAALCEHLASKNIQLAMTGRNKNKLDHLLSSIIEKNHKTFCIDYLKNKQIQDNPFANERFDGIVLITPRPSSNPDTTPTSDIWRELFECGFVGPMEVLRQAIPNLNNNSKIIILSGITSKQYYPALPQFAVLRSMWLAEAKALSNDLGRAGISVNTLSLGGIWTERLSEKIEEESRATGSSIKDIQSHRTHNVPLGKYATFSEIAHVIEQMLGKFTSHISGQNIVLDGGFVSTY